MRKLLFLTLITIIMAALIGCRAVGQGNLSSQEESSEMDASDSDETVFKYPTLSIADRTLEINDARGNKWLVTYADLYNKFYSNASSSGITVYSWKDASEIDPEYLINYFSAQTNWSQTKFEDIYLPGKYLEPYLMRYFDVDAGHLRKSARYHPNEDTYRLAELPHGYMDLITEAAMNENRLTIGYQTFNFNADGSVDSVRKEGRLEVEIESYPELFRYISNEIAEGA